MQISATRPKPVPCTICPASHPAMSPITHPTWRPSPNFCRSGSTLPLRGAGVTCESGLVPRPGRPRSGIGQRSGGAPIVVLAGFAPAAEGRWAASFKSLHGRHHQGGCHDRTRDTPAANASSVAVSARPSSNAHRIFARAGSPPAQRLPPFGVHAINMRVGACNYHRQSFVRDRSKSGGRQRHAHRCWLRTPEHMK
jgi:hypothetical protein